MAILPTDLYQLLQVEMASLAEEERRDAARWQVREMLDYPVEDAVLDLFDVPPFGSDKRPLSYVVCGRKKHLRLQVEQYSAAGLKMAAIDIPEFSLRNITDLYAEDNRGVAILLLREDDGLLVIARDGTLYLTRSFPIGMGHLIPHADGNLEALSEQVDSIVLEVQRSFDYCESTFNLPTVSRLLVAQTGQEVPAVLKYLDDFLATRVEALQLAEVLSLPQGTEQLELNRHLLAIGGALRQESA